MSFDKGFFGDEVNPWGLFIEIAIIGRDIGFVAWFSVMASERPSPQGCGLFGSPSQIRNLLQVGAAIEVSPPAEVKSVARLSSQLFEEVDAAVHEAHHRIPRARPEVPIALRRFVAR
jgi:hypothetical protein